MSPGARLFKIACWVGPASYLLVGSYTKQSDWMNSCTSKGKPLALPWERTPRLDSGVRLTAYHYSTQPSSHGSVLFMFSSSSTPSSSPSLPPHASITTPTTTRFSLLPHVTVPPMIVYEDANTLPKVSTVVYEVDNPIIDDEPVEVDDKEVLVGNEAEYIHEVTRPTWQSPVEKVQTEFGFLVREKPLAGSRFAGQRKLTAKVNPESIKTSGKHIDWVVIGLLIPYATRSPGETQSNVIELVENARVTKSSDN
nr:hypothetical protein [Tanacetum cinerariifolium]